MGRDDDTPLISTHSQSLGYGSITHSHLQSASRQTSGEPLSRLNGLGTDVERQGPEHQRYLPPVYSIISTIWPPSIETLRSYSKLYLKGDIVAALTVASLYIPLSFSFANLAHVSPASSLYAFVFHPIIYALLGSAPLMIVGPEATGSLLIGAAIQKQGHNLESASSVDSLTSGAITALAGSMLIGAGLLRLGFLERILSPPFRHGFISGVGFVLIIEQALVSFGLDGLAKEMGGVDGGAVHKLGFMIQHLARVHYLSSMIALSSLAFILIISAAKKRMGKQNAVMLLFPDRLVAVAGTALITYLFGLDKHGVAIVGSVGSSKLQFPSPYWPLGVFNKGQLQSMANTSMLVAVLGFIESAAAAKSLKPLDHQSCVHATTHSADRDLVALGAANLVGGCFSALPAFGGFGRSKLNIQAGGSTRMSSIFLTAISIVCALHATSWLYYVPTSTLAAMSIAVGISMMEEAHPAFASFLACRAWCELFLLVIVFFTIALHSMGLGITVGFGLTLLSSIRGSTKSHAIMQTKTLYLTESHPSYFLPSQKNCYIVAKVDPSLTFANIDHFKSRLIECMARPGQIMGLILDFRGTTQMDFCSGQALAEVVQIFIKQGHVVLCCRPPSGEVHRVLLSCCVIAYTGQEEYVEDVVEAQAILGRAI
ncbi:hypothetical protein FANTH_12354 [Fusarium anthophilum]|uniref:STAS domain-containing protein n=1 Tax=Fusarium anthophilum TaxID=48485 RepID=A0A8H4YUA4_9HYPO|nr:hypothetical protein FANTH_12354 [Fusarium anthophilum]